MRDATINARNDERNARQRTKTITGYQIQPMLPITFYLDGTVEDAAFTTYEGKTCVEATVRIGIIKNPYTLVLTLKQACEADIIEFIGYGMNSTKGETP